MNKILVVMLIVAVGISGFLFYQNKKKKEVVSLDTTPKIQPGLPAMKVVIDTKREIVSRSIEPTKPDVFGNLRN